VFTKGDVSEETKIQSKSKTAVVIFEKSVVIEYKKSPISLKNHHFRLANNHGTVIFHLPLL
jgi:hypothetical protein